MRGDLLDFVRELKQGDGGDITVCGIFVIRQLLVANLLDALVLTVHPVLVAEGKRLIDAETDPFRLELVEGAITSVGNAIRTYRPRLEESH